MMVAGRHDTNARACASGCALVKLIDKQNRNPIYTDFEDEMGDEMISRCPD